MAGQLIMDEREQIAQFLSQGLSRAEIGRRLGRRSAANSRATVSMADTGRVVHSRRPQRGARRE